METTMLDQKVIVHGEDFETHRRAGGTVREWLSAGHNPATIEALTMSGGSVQNPAWHPFAPPTVSGLTISVPIFLQQPERITRVVRDLTLQRFLLDRLFDSPGGGVTGGAVIYDVVQSNDLYPNRDVELVSPGSEFPIVTSLEVAPSVALSEKWGGKTFILDEAARRNDARKLMNELRRLGNALVRKANQRAVGIIDAAITANSRSVTAHNWTTAILYGTTPTNPQQTPQADLAAAQRQADVEEMGVQYDTLLWNPSDATTFRNVYQGQYQQVLADNGIREAYASNRVVAGTAYLLQRGQVGEYRLEKPLSTETWREQEIQATWIQTDVWPLMFISNPFSILKLTGLAG
jgi:hypothetical protein